MPLHTISEVYGESGLRERFLLEIADLPDTERLTAALELAAELHRDDRYGREPYLNHLLRVSIRIISHYKVRDSELAIAGLLHDAVEDHPAELAGDRPGPGGPPPPRPPSAGRRGPGGRRTSGPAPNTPPPPMWAT